MVETYQPSVDYIEPTIEPNEIEKKEIIDELNERYQIENSGSFYVRTGKLGGSTTLSYLSTDDQTLLGRAQALGLIEWPKEPILPGMDADGVNASLHEPTKNTSAEFTGVNVKLSDEAVRILNSIKSLTSR